MIIVPNGPLEHGVSSSVSSTYSYHRQHAQWETQAPISRFATYTDGGEVYMAASFQCTPVVRYKVSDLVPGVLQAVGETPYDLGGGKQIEDFVFVDRGTDEGSYLLQILTGVAGRIGVATRLSLVKQGTAINEVAPIALGINGDSVHTEVVRVPAVDNAVRMAAYDDQNVVVLYDDALAKVALPSS